MTVPQKVRLARHPLDLDDDGHEVVELGVTSETDTTLRLAPDGTGGVEWGTGGSGGVAEDLTTAETDTTLVLSPDGVGGVEWDTVAAVDVSIADAGTYFAGTNVEAVLQELASKDLGYQSHGNLGSTETFSALTGWHSGTFNANCTATFSGATSGTVASMVLEIESDGASVMTWPGSVVWPGGVEPTLSTTPGVSDVLMFFSHDGGSSWFGFMAGGGGTTSGRWELAVITGSPPDPLYADGDFLYILVP